MKIIISCSPASYRRADPWQKKLLPDTQLKKWIHEVDVGCPQGSVELMVNLTLCYCIALRQPCSSRAPLCSHPHILQFRELPIFFHLLTAVMQAHIFISLHLGSIWVANCLPCVLFHIRQWAAVENAGKCTVRIQKVNERCPLWIHFT